jgi:ribonuclease P/MRP protein subunit POP1
MELGSGWRLVMPASWGMAFWKSFIFCGARPGGIWQVVNFQGLFRLTFSPQGLRERRHRHLETASPAFPYDFPFTQAHKAFVAVESERRLTEHNRKPPAKRPNYECLKITSPFSPDFGVLVGGSWDSCFTIRSPKLLNIIRETLRHCAEVQFCQLQEQLQAALEEGCGKRSLQATNPDWSKAYITLFMTSLHGGTPSDNAVVCIPEEVDYERLLQKEFNHTAERENGEEKGEVILSSSF